MSSNQPWCISISVRATESLLYINTGRLRISGDDSRAPGLVDRVIAVSQDVGGSTTTSGICPNYFSDPIDQDNPVCSELKNSGIRVAPGDCSITECRRWRPPYQTGKTVHVQAKTIQTRVFEAMVSY